jgi:hypothetical protein
MVILGVGMAGRKIGQHANAQVTRACLACPAYAETLSAISLKRCPASSETLSEIV